jgi:hypothetical protein
LADYRWQAGCTINQLVFRQSLNHAFSANPALSKNEDNMMINYFKSMLLMVSIISPIVSSIARAGEIIFVFEEPPVGSIYTGVANVRGWAVGSVGIDRVELYVDGQFFSALPLGGQRIDVGNAYPTYPGSANSGFSAIFNYSSLTAGPHTFRIRVVDREGVIKESSVVFSTVKFDNPYIADPTRFSLDGATGKFGGRSIAFENVVADGKIYNIQLDWRTEIQGFAITKIIHAGSQPPNDYSGTYQLSTSLISNNCNFSVPSEYKETNILKQNSNQLTGKVVEDNLPLSGTVDSQGNFIYAYSVPLESNPKPDCNIKVASSYQGNFAAQFVKITTNIDYTGNCSGSDCSGITQGTIVKIGDATATSESAEVGTGSLTNAILEHLQTVPFVQ